MLRGNRLIIKVIERYESIMTTSMTAKKKIIKNNYLILSLQRPIKMTSF